MAAAVQPATNGRVQRIGLESRHDRRSNARDGPLFDGLLIADPAELPSHAGCGLEGIKRVGWQQTGKARAAHTPPPVDKHLSLAAKTREKIGGRLLGPDNP